MSMHPESVIVMNPVYDVEDHFMAWRADKMDELYSDSKALAEAVEDWLPGGSQEALAGLVAALSGIEKDATPLDNAILQHGAAKKVVDNLVNQVVAAQEKHGVWRDWDWSQE
jgi:hypothetical protein